MDVSIIVPVYNVSPYIEECLRSVMNQSYHGSIECIIVDDVSTDDSISIVNRMIATYHGAIEFQVLHHSHNRGLSAARNTGTIAAKGDYIYYLDSDDIITKDCIEILMNHVESDPSVELIQGNANAIPKMNSVNCNRHMIISHAIGNTDVRNCFYQTRQMIETAWNKLIKRDFLICNNLLFKEGLLYEDILWIFYMMKHLTNVHLEPQVTYIHRIRNGSIMRSTDCKKEISHKREIYHEIFTNLTPGYENTELFYFSKGIALSYIRAIRNRPELKKDLSLYWSISRRNKNNKVCMILLFTRILGMSRWGWIILPLARRAIRPKLLSMDINKLFHKTHLYNFYQWHHKRKQVELRGFEIYV